ncbi:MAG: hypothetical protein MR759_01215 [Ruminococcus sp.]|nr:hypothetical protein [Ruminococcus sp.]
MSEVLEKVLQALIWAAVGTVILLSAVVMFLSFAETYLKVEFKNDTPRTVAKVAFVTVVGLEAAIIAVWIMWLICKSV